MPDAHIGTRTVSKKVRVGKEGLRWIHSGASVPRELAKKLPRSGSIPRDAAIIGLWLRQGVILFQALLLLKQASGLGNLTASHFPRHTGPGGHGCWVEQSLALFC